MEKELFSVLNQVPCRFILSIWHSSRYRKNPFIETGWSKFHILTKEHFYHVDASENNRNSVLEALVMNFEPGKTGEQEKPLKLTQST